MADAGIEVFMRWVLRHGETSDRVRPHLTSATLISDDAAFARLQQDAPAGWLDETLMEEFLSLADPQETVALLTFRIGACISSALFNSVFERTLTAIHDMDVLSRLMFAAGLHLDRHPGAFTLPRKLTDQLLASEDMDHRLGGLKALRHSTASSGEIVAQITSALNRDNGHEQLAALSQLRLVLDERGPQLAVAAGHKVVSELQEALTRLMDVAIDAVVRGEAGHCRQLLTAATTGSDFNTKPFM